MRAKHLHRPAAEQSWGKLYMATGQRQTRRLIMRVPMHIQAVGSPSPAEELVESMNISLRGAYFPTSLELEVGSYVEVRFKVPEEIVSGQNHEWTFTARVTHRQQLGRIGKKYGVGVYFLHDSTHWDRQT